MYWSCVTDAELYIWGVAVEMSQTQLRRLLTLISLQKSNQARIRNRTSAFINTAGFRGRVELHLLALLAETRSPYSQVAL
jgi:hypothetical protein